MPSDSRHITSYTCSMVTITLSRTETLFFSRWPWSGLSRSSKVKLIMPSDLRYITSYTCSIVTIALSRMETLFFSRWPWSGLSRSPKVKLIMLSDSQHITSNTYSVVTIVLSRTGTLFFSRWPRSVLSDTKRQTDFPPASGRNGLKFINLWIERFNLHVLRKVNQTIAINNYYL